MEQIVRAVHRAASWHSPPSPLRLALGQGIHVRPHDIVGTPTIVVGDMLYFAPSGDRRVDGMHIAVGISRILLHRITLPHTEDHVHRLAVELLVPTWILRGSLAALEEAHVWAPRDVIRDRWRTVLRLSAVA